VQLTSIFMAWPFKNIFVVIPCVASLACLRRAYINAVANTKTG